MDTRPLANYIEERGVLNANRSRSRSFHLCRRSDRILLAAGRGRPPRQESRYMISHPTAAKKSAALVQNHERAKAPCNGSEKLDT